MGLAKEFTKGIVSENPVFRILLGLCPTLAVTTSAINGFGMGMAATFVLISSNIIVSLIAPITPHRIRIPVFIMIIATFTTIVDLVMAAYSPALHKALGVFIPLIVVNCIILGRAEAFASKSRLNDSIADGLGMGAGFTLALTLIGSIREVLGNGTIFSLSVFGQTYSPALIMIMPPGAFMVIGILIGLMNILQKKRATT